jgi:hypothetical protein
MLPTLTQDGSQDINKNVRSTLKWATRTSQNFHLNHSIVIIETQRSGLLEHI